MGFERDDLRSYVYLRAVLDDFQSRAIEYCAQEDPAVRFERVKEIRNALIGRGTLPADLVISAPCPPCPEGQHCEGVVCVDNQVNSGWPQGADPVSWDA